jgi:ribose 5-phosphate isomerase B
MAKKKNVVIGCDPNADDLKNIIIKHLNELGHTCEDYGSEDPIYANVAFKVGEAVAAGKFDRGILLCGTGVGMSIAANKVPGVYAALCSDTYSAERAVLSNNTNVMTIGAFTVGSELAKALVTAYMSVDWVSGTRSEPKVQCIVDFAQNHEK